MSDGWRVGAAYAADDACHVLISLQWATAMGGAGLHEFVERLAAHLCAHLQEGLTDRRRDFKEHVDVPPVLDQSGPGAAGDQSELLGGKYRIRPVGPLLRAAAIAAVAV